ncbi:undecaprenyl-diphosphatase UppP [Syntrophomonas curvata]
MTLFHSVLLGAVQGLTEFLPVSSSGHLVIFQHILGVQESPLTFDVMLHMGTLLAVFVAFWDDIVEILKRPFTRLTYLIIVGCIPAALAGYLVAPLIEKAFESLLVVGLGLIFTGFVLRFSEKWSRQSIGLKDIPNTSYKDAIFIGLLQALAIIPGISRSGSTIAAGLFAGMERELAARFSFLLSIPVIIGAGIFELSDVSAGSLGQNLPSYLGGTLVAALFGYLAIKIVLRLVRHGRLSVFSYYCWAAALLTLGYNFLI